jgi:hypothetical protein
VRGNLHFSLAPARLGAILCGCAAVILTFRSEPRGAIALCSVICGGENAMDMAAFAKAKEPLLRGFLRLPNGVPSHDTFSRLFRLLDPAPFGAAFQRFMAVFSQQCQGVASAMRCSQPKNQV